MPSAISLLGYGLVALPYLLASLLGIALPAAGVVCYVRFGAGVAVIFGMYAVEALFMDVGGLQLGIAVYYTDFVLLFIGAIGGLRLLLAHDVPRRHWAWLTFGGAFFISLGTGLATYGSGAGVQARPYFYLLSTAVYGMSFVVDARRLRLLFNALALLAILLIGITTYRWVVYYTPIRELLPEAGVYNNDGPIRVIRSYEATILAEVLVLAIFLPRVARGLGALRWLAPLILGVVIALQHRSAWVAALIGALCALLVVRSRKASAVGQLLLILAIATVTALPLVVSDRLAGVSEQVSVSAESALEGRGTTGERFESWTEIVEKWATGGPRSIAIGQSFGTDPGRYVHDERGGLRRIVYTAHNFYVQTLFSLGLLGLFSFVIAAAFVVRGLYRLCRSGSAEPEASALFVLIAMQLTYYVPYGADYLQSLIFGIGLAYVAGRPRPAAEWAETLPDRAGPMGTTWA